MHSIGLHLLKLSLPYLKGECLIISSKCGITRCAVSLDSGWQNVTDQCGAVWGASDWAAITDTLEKAQGAEIGALYIYKHDWCSHTVPFRHRPTHWYSPGECEVMGDPDTYEMSDFMELHECCLVSPAGSVNLGAALSRDDYLSAGAFPLWERQECFATWTKCEDWSCGGGSLGCLDCEPC